MQARIENIMDCSCRADTCTCCGGCHCKHGAATTTKEGVLNFGVDVSKLGLSADPVKDAVANIKDVATGLTKLSTSVQGFSKQFAGEVQLARDAALGGAGVGLLFGLLISAVVSVFFMRR